jgi:hypothetical protein
MVKFSQLVAPITAALALSVVTLAARATPLFELMISDGSTDVTVVGVGGLVEWTGNIGSYSATIGGQKSISASGTSNGDPLVLHLTAAVKVLTGATPSGALTFTLTQTDLNIGTPGTLLFETTGGGSGPKGSGFVSWGSYIDASNSAFGTSTPLLTCSAYSCAGSDSSQTLTGAYSATLQAVFNYTGVKPINGGSLDLNLQTVPEPTSIALVGLALLGLGFARSRKA